MKASASSVIHFVLVNISYRVAGQLDAFRLNFQPDPGRRQRPGAVDVAWEPMTRRTDRSLGCRGRIDGMMTRRNDALNLRFPPPLVSHAKPESLVEESGR